MRGMYDTETVTITRYGTIREGGNEYKNPEDKTEFTIEGCAVEAGDVREEHERASEQVAAFSVWAPIEFDVQGSAEASFTYAGRVWKDYQVDGDPRLMPDPNGLEAHQLISLIKRESIRKA